MTRNNGLIACVGMQNTPDSDEKELQGYEGFPTKIAEQMASFAAAYDTLNQAYAADLRGKITTRSSELPEAQKMKTACEAIYPEYRVLIQLLNAHATVAASPTAYQQLIQTLNNNIDYVRKHAITKGTSGEELTPDDGGKTDGTKQVNPDERE